MSNQRRTVYYVGFTNDIERRVYEHCTGRYQRAFTKRYSCFHLMWFEEFSSAREAKAFEYKMKRWRRTWKEEVIRSMNPDLEDLAADWDFRDYVE